MLDFPAIEQASGRLFREGRLPSSGEVEDFALGSIDLVDGTNVRLACSWNSSVGADAVIRATFYGTEASAEMRNIDGSFYDFAAELFMGRDRQILASPDDWSGRAAVEWVDKLAAGERFTGSTQGLAESAKLLDRLYGREEKAQAKAAAFFKV